MNTESTLPANDIARRVVLHFQAAGFAGISEAMILSLRLRQSDRRAIEAAFEAALDDDLPPPVNDWFELRILGHHAEGRTFATARAALGSDFGRSLRLELPHIFFAPAPVLVDDSVATGTRYDAMIKLSDNVDGKACVILLNDPDASLVDYLGSGHGTDWDGIVGSLAGIVAALGDDIELS